RAVRILYSPEVGRWEIEKGARDRKSTRLNSSHSQISYAVFCLKKKISDLVVADDLQRVPDLTSGAHRRLCCSSSARTRCTLARRARSNLRSSVTSCLSHCSHRH